MKKKKIIVFIIEISLIGLIIFSLFKIFNWGKDNYENKKILDNLVNSVKVDKKNNKYIVDFKSLKEKNSDTIAYIKVNGTNIEYPVVKSNDNSYYLRRNFEKKYNVAGWPFADYKNKFDGNDKNIVIYGHNMKDGSMFGTLKKTLTTSWQENTENHKIILVTENNQYTYTVFSTYKIENEEYYIKTNFNSDDEYNEFLNTIKKRSNYDYNVTLNSDDQVLTLSSCANNNKYRIVLHAKKDKM